MSQSKPESMNAQVFDVEDGHIVMRYRAESQISLRFQPASGEVEFDLSALQVGTSDKAAIVRAALSPAAAHSLLVQLRAIEDVLLMHIGSQGTPTVQ